MTKERLQNILDTASEYYEKSWFIEYDPISIPKQYQLKQDVEISAFLVATIAWGNRTSILKNGHSIMERMDHSPYEYVTQSTEADRKSLIQFVHRTFNDSDLLFFVEGLKHLYKEQNSLEYYFNKPSLWEGITHFRNKILETPHLLRSEKHISNPQKNSSCKRLYMFFRWMIRRNSSVDFGIWENISPALLKLPLDVHTKKTAEQIGFTSRKANDKKTVEEISDRLLEMDPKDPIKYDFALFGLSAFKNENSLPIFDTIWK